MSSKTVSLTAVVDSVRLCVRDNDRCRKAVVVAAVAVLAAVVVDV